MFHSARALLYRDGIQEKSHYATIMYIKEKYTTLYGSSLITAFNAHKDQRHESLYGLDFEATKEDCITAIQDASAFFKKTHTHLQLPIH